MAQLEVAAHGCTAQVEVAVFHAEVVAAVGVVLYGEWGHLRGVEHAQARGYDLDVAGGEVGVLGRALGHAAGNLGHIFAAEVVGLLAEGGVVGVVEHYLRDAVAVAQVNEGHAAHAARLLYPSGEGNLLAGIGEAKLAARICSVHFVGGFYFLQS